MNADAKKTVLRMIPYGIYVLTADDGKGNVAAATVNWVTQTAFAPPLVVVGVKTNSGAYQIIKDDEDLRPQHAGQGPEGAAFTFFQPADVRTARSAGRPTTRARPARRSWSPRRARWSARSPASSSRATITSSSAR